MTEEQLRYPIGNFIVPETYTKENIAQWKADIKELPILIKNAVSNLTDVELETPYRPGGWTIRQVVHHLADSHTNSILRFKWAMTEENPTIKAYHEDLWAELADYKLPLAPSLNMLDGIHARLIALFDSFTDADWDRTFIHPQTGATISLKRNLALYSWHGRHHLAHIEQAKANINA
ncbi:YfiT family bacillithiol transferase [Mucilaginibacter auburnensis]|uniref:DinB family protein n=1 Tax=Mucilaginibacter auburnensis TaxID=1457233 RepID=A0A2H9VN51_9SPHI|nr:putative metal-dependent hydrolase [Mucilaginibacter auburnensis]PJJ79759.1 DinB family protein [Mucilaginibacter auburnensis]